MVDYCQTMVASSKSIESFCVPLVTFSGKFNRIIVDRKSFNRPWVIQSFNRLFRSHSRALFTWQSNAGNQRDVHIRFVRTEIMECVIDFAYASSCQINDAIVIELLATAEYFGFMELIDQCAHYIANSLTPSNCVSLMAKTRFDCNHNHSHFSIWWISGDFNILLCLRPIPQTIRVRTWNPK